MADKVAIFVEWCSTWLACLTIAFVTGWKLALAVLAFSPAFICVGATVGKVLRGVSVKETEAYARSGAVAEEALKSIRTVQAFQGQEREHSKYHEKLKAGRDLGRRKGVVLGVGTGLFSLLIFSSFAASCYYGVTLIHTDGLLPGTVIMVFATTLLGSLVLGRAFPSLQAFSTARAAAGHVFDVINLRPHIDVTSTLGLTIAPLTGLIEFRDVHFRYPSRPDVPVLRGLSLLVHPGQTVAIVGASGCGKTTTVQLLLRFYDPQHGQISIDGHNVRDLNLRWLRDQMGVVSQEPVLFAATIADNIRYGQPDVTNDLIQAAAMEANAHDFISQLPQGYDTTVGERGAQLSGGQKQRIAIARALVRNPRILLLDEATSALDHKSEAVVQSALDKARQGRTTIVIAHRLSTIRHADVIVTLSGGRKMEEGSHEELMAQRSMYAQLVSLQSRAEQEEVGSIAPADVNLHEDKDTDINQTMTNSTVTSWPGSVTSAEKCSGCGDVASVQWRERDSETGNTHTAKDNEKDVKEGKEEEEEKEKVSQVSLGRLLKLNCAEWPLLIWGIVTSGLVGLGQPAFTFIFSQFLSVFALRSQEEQRQQSAVLCSIISAIGLAVAVVRMMSVYCLAKAGSALTARLRSRTFGSMLRQDMAFFDDQDHQVGRLTTRLSSDAALIQGATGSKLGSAIEATVAVMSALTISLVFGWKLTLVILAFVPLVIASGRMQGRAVSGAATGDSSRLEGAGKICSEAVDNIRTVTSLNRADVFLHKMDCLLDRNSRRWIRTAQVLGLTYGISVSVKYFVLAVALTYGTYLVTRGEMEFYNIFRVLAALVTGGSEVGNSISFGVDYKKARLAADRLFAIMDRGPAIDIQHTGGKTLKEYRGSVSLEKAVFQYPSRPGVGVLCGLSVHVQPGMTVALVGPSGCGKSTLLQLLLRFYDPTSGSVLLDGEDARSLDLRWLRQQLAVVSQEPTLFDDTIAANIQYGDTRRHVPMDDVISAARAANIHTFISSLPQGYNTRVGDKGTQLSGGQKQRVAIARALVRQPKVLLLDEATSALDTESERVVQEALDKAREGRTCIVIAHRLTTVQNADLIALIQNGRVQETGTHSQLLASKGAYYNLLQTQQASEDHSIQLRL